MNKTYEELSDELHMCHEHIAELVQKRDELAAHINQIHECFSFDATTRPQDVCRGVLNVLKQAPAASLARRDLISASNELEQSYRIANRKYKNGTAPLKDLLDRALELRQQAEALSND